jgi:translation elongation factor EF-1beta
MEIRPQTPKSEYDSALHTEKSVANAMSVFLDVNKKKVEVRRSKIKDIAKGLAEIAFNIGDTNDPETYAEEMTENIFEAYKKVEKKQKEKKKKQH